MSIVSGLSVPGKLAMLTGEFSSSDVYKIALYGENAHITPLTETYETSGEVSGQGYEKGGMVLEGYTAGVDGMTACITWAKNPVWKNATISAQGALIYNASKRNKAVVVVEFGKVVTSTNGNWTFPMPQLTSSTAIIRIS